MSNASPFKWRHFEAEIIVLCVRWYLRYSLSYRDLEEMMAERGLRIDHTTIYRWVQHYAPELEKRARPHLKTCNDSWKVDETYIKVRKNWMYLYRAVDSEGNTLEYNGPKNVHNGRGKNKLYLSMMSKHYTAAWKRKSGAGTLKRREDLGANCFRI